MVTTSPNPLNVHSGGIWLRATLTRPVVSLTGG